MPFTFTELAINKESIFSKTIDLRELLKENNIYSHFLDFYFNNVKIDSNNTFLFSLSAKYENIWSVEKKCGVKEEPREEYLYDNYDNDCLSMIEHINPKNASGPEKRSERKKYVLLYYLYYFCINCTNIVLIVLLLYYL